MAEPTTAELRAKLQAARQAGLIGLDEYLNELAALDNVPIASLANRVQGVVEGAMRATYCVGLAILCPDGTIETKNGRIRVKTLETKYGRMRVKKMGSGFAVYVPSGRLILTCEHVRRDARREQEANPGSVLIVCPHSGGNESSLDWLHAWEADVLAHTHAPHHMEPAFMEPASSQAIVVDENTDLAVLEANRAFQDGASLPTDLHLLTQSSEEGVSVSVNAVVLRIGASSKLKPTETLYALGYPVGSEFSDTPTPSKGSYAMTTSTDHDGPWHKFEGMIAGGHSGGPVITEEGKVIGWNVRNALASQVRDRGASGLNHVRPIEAARACVEATGVRWEEVVAGPKPQEVPWNHRAAFWYNFSLILGAIAMMGAAVLFGLQLGKTIDGAAVLALSLVLTLVSCISFCCMAKWSKYVCHPYTEESLRAEKATFPEVAIELPPPPSTPADTRRVVGQLVEVNTTNEKADTALIIAAENGNEAVAAQLLEKGASVDATFKTWGGPWRSLGEQGWENRLHWTERLANTARTALIIAAQKGHLAVARLLLEKGASVDAADKDGNTALIWASMEGREAVVKLLIEKGASVDKANKKGKTAQEIAARMGHHSVVRLLPGAFPSV